jgi:hypothetical protein
MLAEGDGLSNQQAATRRLLLGQGAGDPDQSGVDMGDPVLQDVDRNVRIECADHRTASGALQNRDGALFAERRDKAAFKGMSAALRAS